MDKRIYRTTCKTCDKQLPKFRNYCNSKCRIAFRNRNRIYRICNTCNKRFQPVGKTSRACGKCVTISIRKGIIKRRKTMQGVTNEKI